MSACSVHFVNLFTYKNPCYTNLAYILINFLLKTQTTALYSKISNVDCIKIVEGGHVIVVYLVKYLPVCTKHY